MRPSGAEDIRDVVQHVIRQLDRPLVDTWGCLLHDYVMMLVARLGAVSTAVHRIAEGRPERESDHHEHLIKQLAELAANTC